MMSRLCVAKLMVIFYCGIFEMKRLQSGQNQQQWIVALKQGDGNQ